RQASARLFVRVARRRLVAVARVLVQTLLELGHTLAQLLQLSHQSGVGLKQLLAVDATRAVGCRRHTSRHSFDSPAPQPSVHALNGYNRDSHPEQQTYLFG